MCFKTLQKNNHVSLLLLRIVIGCVFLTHGYMKWEGFEAATPLFKLLAIVEPLGGIALIVGGLTRWAALGLSIIMLGAMWMKIGNVGITGFAGKGGWEFDALVFAACVMMMTSGAGKWSFDKKAGWDK